jgi:aminopeptidase
MTVLRRWCVESVHMDSRIRRHAEVLVDHCTDVRSGDNVLVRAPLSADELVVALYEQFGKRGAQPSLSWRHPRAGRAYARAMDEGDFETNERELAAMRETDVVILIGGSRNAAEQNDMDPSKMGPAQRARQPIWRNASTPDG